MLAHRVLTRKRFSHCLIRGPTRFAELLNVTSLPLTFDPGCRDHDSPADDREAQVHEEERANVAYPPKKFVGADEV
jgi:hypothetical protein